MKESLGNAKGRWKYANIHTNTETHSPSYWSLYTTNRNEQLDRVLPEKLNDNIQSDFPRISSNLTAHYRIHKILPLILFWTISIHSTTQPNIWWSVFILHFHLRLGLPRGLFPSGLPHKSHMFTYPLIHYSMYVTCQAQSLECIIKHCTGLNKMIVRVSTTCHTQYTWDRSICIFKFNFCCIHYRSSICAPFVILQTSTR